MNINVFAIRQRAAYDSTSITHGNSQKEQNQEKQKKENYARIMCPFYTNLHITLHLLHVLPLLHPAECWRLRASKVAAADQS